MSVPQNPTPFLYVSIILDDRNIPYSADIYTFTDALEIAQENNRNGYYSFTKVIRWDNPTVRH